MFKDFLLVALIITLVLVYVNPELIDKTKAKVNDVFDDTSITKIKGVVTDVVDEIDEGLSPEPTDINTIEDEVLRLVNIERSKYKAVKLKMSSSLRSYARDWSQKMIDDGMFEHSNLNFPFSSLAAENIGETPRHYSVIGCGSTYSNKNMAKCIVDGWITSSGHHENMINPVFVVTGIGIACNSVDCKSTQVFAG